MAGAETAGRCAAAAHRFAAALRNGLKMLAVLPPQAVLVSGHSFGQITSFVSAWTRSGTPLGMRRASLL